MTHFALDLVHSGSTFPGARFDDIVCPRNVEFTDGLSSLGNCGSSAVKDTKFTIQRLCVDIIRAAEIEKIERGLRASSIFESRLPCQS